MRAVPYIILATLGSACGSSPLAPSTSTAPMIDPSLSQAVTLAGPLSRHVTSVRFGPLAGISAQYQTATGTIVIAASLTGQDDRVLAGLVAHESAHADGAQHDCGDDVRDTDLTGAWGAHARTLDRLGVDHQIPQTQVCR